MERLKLFEKGYRRILIDSHIADSDKRFHSEFDPEKVVEMYSLAKASSVIVEASCQLGNCYWQTKIGHMHKGLRRDVLGEIIKLCHQKNIAVVLSYVVGYNKFAYENNPSWKMIDVYGKVIKDYYHQRLDMICLNSQYRDFVLCQIDELCSNYEFEGIFFDMVFWRGICYCNTCKKRYTDEVGEEIPKTVNWQDPKWVKFQRKREEWLSELMSSLIHQVKKNNPKISVYTQSSNFIWPWWSGITLDTVKECDYAGGDIYGDRVELSFLCKFFMNLTNNKPFEIHRSHCYHQYFPPKPAYLMETEAFSVISNGGAILFIDAINPKGTLDKLAYQRIKNIFKKVKKYESYIGGELRRDIGVYFSREARINFSNNGKPATHELTNGPHPKAVLNTCRALLNVHLPFDVITKKNIKELSDYQIVILPNLLMMDEEEIQYFIKFVQEGGSLYASKYTSLLTKEGEMKNNFLFSDLFGVDYLGETEEELTYIIPENNDSLANLISIDYPLINFGTQIRVKVKNKKDIIAYIGLPYTNPKDKINFATFHENPFGISTNFPAIILHNFGKGKVCYVAGDLESSDYEIHQMVFINLIKRLANMSFVFEVEAPKSVEVTLFHQEENKRYIINILNFQRELPNIPVENVKIRIRLDYKKPEKLLCLPERKKLSFEVKRDYLEFIIPKLETFLMLALDYK